MAPHCRYSCDTAAQTLEWISAINDFLRPYMFLLNDHVVNFFKDRLWESIDKQWMNCLRKESVENLLKIPSGIVQDNWPASLKEFILTSRSLVLPREQVELQMMLPNLHVASLDTVLTQGMNMKKKHEVETLAAVVRSIAESTGSQTIIDVGAGQGYLAQVLSFQYNLSVVAIDASSHHGAVTSARAERIKKHYAAKTKNAHLNVPQTVTCCVMSSDALKAFSDALLQKNDFEPLEMKEIDLGEPYLEGLEVERKKPSLCSNSNMGPSLVLAGLHACGDLSVTMLRTFIECKEIKAVVSIGCCYNLLSEEGSQNSGSQCGFPVSEGAKLSGLSLGKSARDLACQSAERWRSLTKDAALQNFELHAFRAAFQMVLNRYYPEILTTSPSIGRQGKALRRQQQRRVLQNNLHVDKRTSLPLVATWEKCEMERSCTTSNYSEAYQGDTCSTLDRGGLSLQISSSYSSGCEGIWSLDRYSLFEKFCNSGLCRLGLLTNISQEIDFLGLWKEAQPFCELIGPYWSLRAVLGPVLETLLLLDRLLFLQEQGSSVKAVALPIFNPILSPRNVAIIAQKI
ncbi:PREDICTED: protein RRNAD1 isoform X3 [Nelumbo nucifera]|uniref:Protein RRNAD1 isoform X3 n=1 Tax=Nelumbo nucifera TaxID=4432 RepID=A0A1U7ZXX9_NELNU|nr:PREDICTED: protein RRNAD1 isoform X3 [Nelumbo nucifera]